MTTAAGRLFLLLPRLTRCSQLFVTQNYQIPSGEMRNTNCSCIVIRSFVYWDNEPSRGDKLFNTAGKLWIWYKGTSDRRSWNCLINFLLAWSFETGSGKQWERVRGAVTSNLTCLKTRSSVTRVLITTKAGSRFMHREFQWWNSRKRWKPA